MAKYVLVFFVLVLITAVYGGPLSHLGSGFVRIVGGQSAKIENYPYQVSVMINDQHACGGSVLSNTIILTAAHCFNEESRVARISVRVGSSQRTSGGQIFRVKKINSHRSFNYDTFDYDCAVVELASALTFGTDVQPIKLPSSSSKMVDGENGIATGWGFLTNDGPLADQLQVVTLPLITTSKCQKNYYGKSVSSRMFCAGASGKDTCTGDSGGPLVTNGVQVGIVSWGDVCGAASTPGVYTKVTELLSYINQFLKN